MGTCKSIKRLCEEEGKSEWLNELEYDEQGYFKPQSPSSRINPGTTELQWKCNICNNYTVSMTFEQRKAIDVVKCKRCKARETKIRNAKSEGTPSEFRNLCKLLQTSLPEQCIFAYMQKLFPNAVRSMKFDWLGTSEFDIFIPELNFAIEYDGSRWHQDESFAGIFKDDVAKENGITMFRVREKGLEKKETSHCYIYNHKRSYDNIYEPINAIIQFINDTYEKNYELIKKEDERNIFEELKELSLENLRKEKFKISIANCWSEIDEFWDWKENEGLKPSDILPNGHFTVKAKCPYCNQDLQFIPYIAYHWGGKNSFSPHLCDEQNEYCMKLLKDKFKNGKIKLSMENLDDRRLKDWLICNIRGFNFGKVEKVKKECEKIGFSLDAMDLVEKYGIAKPEDFRK